MGAVVALHGPHPGDHGDGDAGEQREAQVAIGGPPDVHGLREAHLVAQPGGQAPGDEADGEYAQVGEHQPGLGLLLALGEVGPGGQAVGEVVLVIERDDGAGMVFGVRG